MDTVDLLLRELKGSFDFFRDYTNLTPGSPGFGLTVDSTKNRDVSSIASVGFALTAWVIGDRRGYLPHAEALEITRGTLETLLTHVDHHRGFFAHLCVGSCRRKKPNVLVRQRAFHLFSKSKRE